MKSGTITSNVVQLSLDDLLTVMKPLNLNIYIYMFFISAMGHYHIFSTHIFNGIENM